MKSSSFGRLRRHWRVILEVTLTLALISTCGAILWAVTHEHRAPAPVDAGIRPPTRPTTHPPEPPLPAEPISLAGAALQGSAATRVVLIEYSDFQCPYCGVFARDTLPTIEKQYVATGKVQIAFRHVPLSIHQFALGAAVAADCARQQGKFWPMHDALFANQKQLDASGLHDRAVIAGLDMKQFEACVAGPTTATITLDAEAARKLSVNGTPTFFLGTIQPDGRVKVMKRLSGALPVAQFSAALDAAIAAAILPVPIVTR